MKTEHFENNSNSNAVYGKWVYDHWCEFKCSICGYFSTTTPRGKENYCPNCGAKMSHEDC